MAFKKKVFINALYGNATLRTVSIQLKLKKGKQPLKPRRHSKMLDSGLLYGRLHKLFFSLCKILFSMSAQSGGVLF